LDLYHLDLRLKKASRKSPAPQHDEMEAGKLLAASKKTIEEPSSESSLSTLRQPVSGLSLKV
jgi:hypothetical protein